MYKKLVCYVTVVALLIGVFPIHSSAKNSFNSEFGVTTTTYEINGYTETITVFEESPEFTHFESIIINEETREETRIEYIETNESVVVKVYGDGEFKEEAIRDKSSNILKIYSHDNETYEQYDVSNLINHNTQDNENYELLNSGWRFYQQDRHPRYNQYGEIYIRTFSYETDVYYVEHNGGTRLSYIVGLIGAAWKGGIVGILAFLGTEIVDLAITVAVSGKVSAVTSGTDVQARVNNKTYIVTEKNVNTERVVLNYKNYQVDYEPHRYYDDPRTFREIALDAVELWAIEQGM